MDKKEFC
ncbi:hypothetical protein GWI33_014807, partial [Rhynchophorus ferrugineus]